jgi:hypothetical protein
MKDKKVQGAGYKVYGARLKAKSARARGMIGRSKD